MEWAALIAWVLTAGGGFVMLARWLSRGGPRQARDGGSRIRTPLIMSHFLLAATGLVLWIVYLFADNTTIAWIAFALLLVVAVLGFSMLAIWLGQRRGRMGAVGAVTAEGLPAEQHFPVAIVALHGLLAASTLVLVLLAAANVGGGS